MRDDGSHSWQARPVTPPRTGSRGATCPEGVGHIPVSGITATRELVKVRGTGPTQKKSAVSDGVVDARCPFVLIAPCPVCTRAQTDRCAHRRPSPGPRSEEASLHAGVSWSAWCRGASPGQVRLHGPERERSAGADRGRTPHRRRRPSVASDGSADPRGRGSTAAQGADGRATGGRCGAARARTTSRWPEHERRCSGRRSVWVSAGTPWWEQSPSERRARWSGG